MDIHEVILRGEHERLVAHYLIAVFRASWRRGEPVAGSDAAMARFVRIDDIEQHPLTEGAAALVRRAWARMQTDTRAPSR